MFRMRCESCPTLALSATVLHVEDLCPTLRRITLGGPELEHFGVDGPSMDLRFKLVLPTTGSSHETVLACLDDIRPTSLDSGDDSSWYRQWLSRPEDERGAMRTYTAREIRRGEAGTEVVVDVVLHLDEVDGELVGGPATLWAAGAVPGDRVTVIGPNRAVCGPGYGGIEWRPGTARDVLLVGDETAVPAIAAICTELARGDDVDPWRGTVLLEVSSEADRVAFEAPDGVRVQWLARNGSPRGALLAAAVAEAAPPLHRFGSASVDEVDVDHSILWETADTGHKQRYAWVAGEAGSLKPLRRWLLGPAGYQRDEVAIMGYWREGRAG